MPTLEPARYRFNPALELVVFDRLEPGLQLRLASLTRDPSFYGVILPVDREAAAATAKAVDRESALLLLTLRTPGPIPGYARRLLGPDAWNTITGLVLDGILEIEAAGLFRSGPAAIDSMGPGEYDQATDDSAPRGPDACTDTTAFRWRRPTRRPRCQRLTSHGWGSRRPVSPLLSIAIGRAPHRAPTVSGCVGPPRSAGNRLTAPAGRANST
jgi:hypothetical protein